MRTKVSIVLLVLAGCVAVAGLVQGNDTVEANIGITGLVIGIVIWVAMLEIDRNMPERTPGRHATLFRWHVEFMLAVDLVLEFTILVMLFVSSLALVLVVVEWDAPLAVVCATAVLVLARVAIPQTKACVRSIRVLYGRAERA